MPTHFGRRRAVDIWLRQPTEALALLGGANGSAARSATAESLRAWLLLTHERDEKAAEKAARTALGGRGDTRFASAVLAEVLLRRAEYAEAIDVLAAARARYPDVPWYELTLADALVDAGHLDAAEALLAESVAKPRLRRHALKRLSHLALDRGDQVTARAHFEALVALAPDYLVYASDYVELGRLQLEDGDREAAHQTWRQGRTIYPRHTVLRALLAEHFDDHDVTSTPRIASVCEDDMGVTRVRVRTPIISLRTGLLEIVDEHTRDLRQPGDVIALSESAVAAGQGRILPLELVKPGPLARTLCRFVGALGPLHSPEGMQGAIMQCGRARIVAGAAAGGVGKLVRRSGWFYRVAGPGAAMIDDVAACLPPHDHHLIFGPDSPDSLSYTLAAALGCDVAIVDANHRSGAWVVGASAGVDRPWLSAALADNPAGNEDEQTPVVLVRRVSHVALSA